MGDSNSDVECSGAGFRDGVKLRYLVCCMQKKGLHFELCCYSDVRAMVKFKFSVTVMHG